MGSASAAGVDRARIAAEQAVASPLLEGVNLSGAKGVLVNITAAKGGLRMKEVNEVMNTVKASLPPRIHPRIQGGYTWQRRAALSRPAAA